MTKVTISPLQRGPHGDKGIYVDDKLVGYFWFVRNKEVMRKGATLYAYHLTNGEVHWNDGQIESLKDFCWYKDAAKYVRDTALLHEA